MKFVFSPLIGLVAGVLVTVAAVADDLDLSTSGTEHAFIPLQNQYAYNRMILREFHCEIRRIGTDGVAVEKTISLTAENVTDPILVARHFHNFYFHPTTRFWHGISNTWIFTRAEFFPDGGDIAVRFSLSSKTQQDVLTPWYFFNAKQIVERPIVAIQDSVRSLAGFTTDSWKDSKGERLFKLPTGHYVSLSCR